MKSKSKQKRHKFSLSGVFWVVGLSCCVWNNFRWSFSVFFFCYSLAIVLGLLFTHPKHFPVVWHVLSCVCFWSIQIRFNSHFLGYLSLWLGSSLWLLCWACKRTLYVLLFYFLMFFFYFFFFFFFCFFSMKIFSLSLVKCMSIVSWSLKWIFFKRGLYYCPLLLAITNKNKMK